jgi:hypothetical protein
MPTGFAAGAGRRGSREDRATGMRRIAAALCVATSLAVTTAASEHPAAAAPEAAIAAVTCPPGTYDMLDWMTMDADLRSTYHMKGAHRLYTVVWPDKFWWIKHESGNIWDTWLYDDYNIYWYLTEQDQGASWDDPMAARNFKKASYDRNYVVAKRCQEAGGAVSSLGWNDTSYDRYKNCAFQARQDLGGPGRYRLLGPRTASLGGSLPSNLQVLWLTHEYNCNPGTGECKSREVYWLAKRYGLVTWEFFERPAPGQPERLIAAKGFNTLTPGVKAPNFPCF